MQKLTLTEANAADILEQTIARNTPVALVALDYNWGPPVSGRFDTDFVQIWAAARTDVRPRAVKLLLRRPWESEKWDEMPFQLMRECEHHGLYFVDAGLLSEFVIKLETEDGRLYFDNNGGYGVNYRLNQYGGRGTTAVAGEGAIWKLKGIMPVSLLWRKR